jgi:hypothetical protein
MGASPLSVEPPERGFQSQLETGKAFAGGRVPWETGERVPSMRALSGRLGVEGDGGIAAFSGAAGERFPVPTWDWEGSARGRVLWETGERVPSMRALSGRLSVVGPEIRNRVLLSVLVKLLLLRLLKKSIEFLKLFFIQAGEGEFRWTWF